MRDYFRNIFLTVKTIFIGMRITLKYCFAQPVTVQYPDVAPVLQPRFSDLCAKACPVDCIYIEKSGPRKIDKDTGIALGGAMQRYAIDYSKCMFCALCTDPCPTDCIHMGNIHDMSGYDRESMIVEFTDLAKQGLQTPMPVWMQKERIPAWAQTTKDTWLKRGEPLREEMVKALSEQKAAKKPAAEKPAAEKEEPVAAEES